MSANLHPLPPPRGSFAVLFVCFSCPFQRFLFDLELLEQDYVEDPTDLHTLYYLGEQSMRSTSGAHLCWVLA